MLLRNITADPPLLGISILYERKTNNRIFSARVRDHAGHLSRFQQDSTSGRTGDQATGHHRASKNSDRMATSGKQHVAHDPRQMSHEDAGTVAGSSPGHEVVQRPGGERAAPVVDQASG